MPHQQSDQDNDDHDDVDDEDDNDDDDHEENFTQMKDYDRNPGSPGPRK